ncbi:MAG: nucleoid-associated protein [Erysipelotrichales bacterium]|nr:nucleoid-associated protein [Erysipelotrichales bacterium]
MIQINKAILHIFDFAHSALQLSEKEMSTDDISHLTFARQQIEKLLVSPLLKKGQFKESSKVKDLFTQYLDEDTTFMNISTQIANSWYSYIKLSDKILPSALLVLDIYDNEKQYLVFLRYKNRNAFTFEDTMIEGKKMIRVVENDSILSSRGITIDECFFVDLNALHILYKDNKYVIAEEQCSIIADRLLFCTSELSHKEILTTVKESTEDFCDHYALDALSHLAKTQTYIQEKLADDGYLDVNELAEEVFDNPIMQEEFTANLMDQKVPERVHMHAKYAEKATKMIKMKTDTGIQISIPSVYFDDPEYFEVIHNEDQTLTIQIKNALYIK